MDEWSRRFDSALKLVLWFQFWRLRLFDALWRFYGLVWLVSGLVLYLSLWALLGSGSAARLKIGPPWLFALALPAVLAGVYVIGRLTSPLLSILLSVLVPATLIITPSIESVNSFMFPSPDERVTFASSGDMLLFTKGAVVCLGLTALVLLLQSLSRLPSSRKGSRRWPLRWATTCVILASNLAALELLRISLGLGPGVRLPWSRPLSLLVVEPGWPYALTLWVWINVGYLLSRYDVKLIPYLLRRMGQPWAPNELSVHETYLVDFLLTELGGQPGSAGGSARHHRRRHHRG